MAHDGGVVRGAIWMLVLNLLLFWLPFAPLLAGVVGGKKSGGVGSALLAAILPGLVLGGLLFFFGTALTGIPVIGFVVATLGGVYYLAGVGLLLLGAFIGGLLA